MHNDGGATNVEKSGRVSDVECRMAGYSAGEPPAPPDGDSRQPVTDSQPSNRQTVKPSNCTSWAQRAREALAVPREVMDSMTNYTDDPAVLYRWRDEMADLIEEAR